MLKRRPLGDLHQMIPWYVGEYTQVQNAIDFESARELLMEADKKLVQSRRCESIRNMMICISYMEYEKTPENNEIFHQGFKNRETKERWISI